MLSLRAIALLVLAFEGLAGCTVPDPKDIAARMRILELEPGMTRSEVERRVQSRPLHQFTCMHDDDEMLCTSHWFPGLPRMYLVYRDGALEKITPARDWRLNSTSTTDDVHEPLGRIDLILAQPPLTREGIQQYIVAAERSDAIRRRYSEPEALYPAIALTAPLALLMLPRDIARDLARDARYQRLTRRFDPFKIRTGMTAAEVDALYGAAARVVVNDLETRVYGEHMASEGTNDYAVAWVAVQFRDGRAVAVLSHDFLTEPMLRTEGRQTYLDQD